MAASSAVSYDAAILQAYAEWGVMTEEEVAETLDVPRPSLSPCFKPLEPAGKIVKILNPDGSLMKRRNRSGKLAMVRGLPCQQIHDHSEPQMPDLEEAA